METDLVALYRQVLEDKDLKFEEQLKLLDEIRKIAPPDQHRYHIRYAMWTLMGVALSIPVLFWLKGEVSSGLLSIGSTAVGAFSAYLTTATRRRQEAAPNIMPSKNIS